MNTKLFLLIGTSLPFIPCLAFAQCVATQDCTTLGYTETSCNGGKGVKCPFGNKWACFKSDSEFCNEYGFNLNCTGSNQIGGASKACNGKYNACKCATNFNWNMETQSCLSNTDNCYVGTLYYTDGTCSMNNISGKTILGVVIMEKTSASNGWIMTVNPIQTGIMWGTYGTDITELENFYSTPNDIQASCTNTSIITAYGNSSKYPAAWAAKNYKPAGTPSGKSWCLPSGGLLNTAINNATNFARINAAIVTAKGTKLGYVYDGYEYIISSSEENKYNYWALFINDRGKTDIGTSFNGHKNGASSDQSIRPVMEF